MKSLSRSIHRKSEGPIFKTTDEYIFIPVLITYDIFIVSTVSLNYLISMGFDLF